MHTLPRFQVDQIGSCPVQLVVALENFQSDQLWIVEVYAFSKRSLNRAGKQFAMRLSFRIMAEGINLQEGGDAF